MFEIAPSVLAAHPLFMDRDIRRVLDAGITLLHLDIMDGHFVPNLSYGPALVAALSKQYPGVTLDVHLMLSNPGAMLDAFIEAGAHEITVHAEIDEDVPALLRKIKAAGLRAGVSIKPATAVASMAQLLPEADLVLLMSVEPGFGGQKLMEETLPKLGELRQAGFSGTLSVDGGVTPGNAALVRSFGATRLVMGTAVFRAEDPAAVIASLAQA